jgi:hypothetical protein
MTSPSQETQGVGALSFDWPIVRVPSAEESRVTNLMAYERVSHTFLDRWPAGLMDLSFPTKFIPVDPAQMMRLWDAEPRDVMESVASEIAASIDAVMGWDNWFVRLNSRSPKDASHPVAPVTCSGKQAVSWLWASERALDDCCMFFHAKKPMFICLREYVSLHKDAEFRCFASGGKVRGVSRYFYNEPPEHDGEIDADFGQRMLDAAERFYTTHLAQNFDEIVFDLYAPGTHYERLIEINPYGMSDPCLFAGYDDIEQTGGFRWNPLAITEPPE